MGVESRGCPWRKGPQLSLVGQDLGGHQRGHLQTARLCVRCLPTCLEVKSPFAKHPVTLLREVGRAGEELKRVTKENELMPGER